MPFEPSDTAKEDAIDNNQNNDTKSYEYLQNFQVRQVDQYYIKNFVTSFLCDEAGITDFISDYTSHQSRIFHKLFQSIL